MSFFFYGVEPANILIRELSKIPQTPEIVTLQEDLMRLRDNFLDADFLANRIRSSSAADVDRIKEVEEVKHCRFCQLTDRIDSVRSILRSTVTSQGCWNC